MRRNPVVTFLTYNNSPTDLDFFQLFVVGIGFEPMFDFLLEICPKHKCTSRRTDHLKKVEIIPLMIKLLLDYGFPSYPLPFEKYFINTDWLDQSLLESSTTLHLICLFNLAS